MRRPDAGTIALLLVAALGAAGLILTSPHPDVDAPTIVPCNVYATTSTPDLPPHTLPDVCSTPTGELSTPTNP